jgi:hypothetical protein
MPAAPEFELMAAGKECHLRALVTLAAEHAMATANCVSPRFYTECAVREGQVQTTSEVGVQASAAR